ncbi:MAG: TIGR02270 family protein [Gammaproteobacteria bacterium]|nr:TIGR02270 family protein [Gammaproteobacteria bacterium]
MTGVDATTTTSLPDQTEDFLGEASFLWLQRAYASLAPNYSPNQLADLDERLAAHIDGLRVAESDGWSSVESGLDNGGPEDFFPAAVLALEAQDGRFDDLLVRLTDTPEAIPGVISALGWVSASYLGGRVKSMLEDPSPLKQKLGIAACALHRKDPGPALNRCLASTVDSVRIRALRAAGELGRMDVMPLLRAALGDPKPEVCFWAAWSAVLLGDRALALETLVRVGLSPGRRQLSALQLALQAMDANAGHELLMELDEASQGPRLRIVGFGFIGDPSYVPWLIEQVAKPAIARIAAEAFVNITGADFNREPLESLPPDGFDEGPTEDPDDENVELPEDIALPWPDVERMRAWWQKNNGGFQAGQRYFLGEPPSVPRCTRILQEGFQRQRIAAALYLSLLQPGRILFPTSAPAWRQARLLAAVEAE